MANIEKFRKPEISRIINHCASKVMEDGTVMRVSKSSSSNIDPSRTKLNYNLASGAHPGYTDTEYVKHRLTGEGVRVLNRQDVNALSSFVITIPKNLWEEEPERTKEFFQTSYDFFKGIVGEENIVSSWVHMDETTPHMHFLFTPIVKEKNRPGYHLSSKEMLHDCYGADFHLRMKQYLEERMGRDIDVANHATAKGNKTIAELKLASIKSEISDLQKEKDELIEKKDALSSRLEEAMKIINEKVKEKKDIEKESEKLETEKQILLNDIDALKKKYDALVFARSHAENELSQVQMYKGYAVISEQQWGKWKPYIENGEASKKAAEELRKEENLYESAARAANFMKDLSALQKENERLKKENEEEKRKNEEYDKELSEVKEALGSMADFMEGIRIKEGQNLLTQYQLALEAKAMEMEEKKRKEKEEER